MLRLIDADKLRKDILDLPNCYNGYSDTYDKACIIDMIDEQPTVGAERHGRWIKNEDRSGWHCSCCGKDDLYAYPYTQNNERELQDFYCPNCGAKMDEKEDGGTVTYYANDKPVETIVIDERKEYAKTD